MSYNVAHLWQDTAILLHAVLTQEMFLKFRNFFCVEDTKFVSATNVARMAKESTFGRRAHVSNIAATMCPDFAGLVCCVILAWPLGNLHFSFPYLKLF